MAVFGNLSTIRSQVPAAAFGSCFAYLDDLFTAGSAAALRLRQIAEGETRRIELSGGSFALEQVYLSKRRTEGFFESHRGYIDVQVVFDGEEGMEVIDLGRVTVKQPYDSNRDLLIYEDNAGSLLRVRSGQGAVFHPVDVHMPGLCGEAGPQLVRKTVIKVPVGSV